MRVISTSKMSTLGFNMFYLKLNVFQKFKIILRICHRLDETDSKKVAGTKSYTLQLGIDLQYILNNF